MMQGRVFNDAGQVDVRRGESVVGDAPSLTLSRGEHGDVKVGDVLCTSVVSHRCGFREGRTQVHSRLVKQGGWMRTMGVTPHKSTCHLRKSP